MVDRLAEVEPIHIILAKFQSHNVKLTGRIFKELLDDWVQDDVIWVCFKILAAKAKKVG